MKKTTLPILLGIIMITTWAIPSSASVVKLMHYFTVKVIGPDNVGMIYVSESADTPSNYDNLTSGGKSYNFDWFSKSDTHTVYLHIKETNPRYKFTGWAGPQSSAEKVFAVTLEGNTNLTKRPTYTFNANFERISAVLTGYDPSDFAGETPEVTISEVVNHIGDRITVSARAPFIGFGIKDKEGNDARNTHYEFRGWVDQNGNTLSTDPDYTFTVTENLDLKARFGFRPAIGPGAGYYRIRSYRQDRNEYVKVVGNIENNGGGKFNAQAGIGDRHFMTANMVFTDYANEAGEECEYYRFRYDDPSTIFFFNEGYRNTDLHPSQLQEFTTDYSTGCVFQAQGVDTKTFFKDFGEDVELYSGCYPGSVAMIPSKYSYNASKARKCYLAWSDGKPDFGGFAFIGDKDIFSTLELEPIDETHIDQFYFGASATPESYYDGRYWTPMFTTFPYALHDGVAAYYITADESGRHLVLLSSEAVPANTAVILGCMSTDPSQNRLVPLVPGDYRIPVAPTDNVLRGVLQLNDTKVDENSPELYCYSWNNHNHGYKRIDDTTYIWSVWGVDGYAPTKKRTRSEFVEQDPAVFRKVESPEMDLKPNSVYLDGQELADKMGITLDQLDTRLTVHENASIPTSVNAIGTDSDTEAVYYNLQGIKIADPVKGQLYLRATSQGTSKVVF